MYTTFRIATAVQIDLTIGRFSRFKVERYKLKSVFMSGYAASSHTHDTIPDNGEAVLNKPFKRVDLATVIHDTLAA